jgi:hypothetical protein
VSNREREEKKEFAISSRPKRRKHTSNQATVSLCCCASPLRRHKTHKSLVKSHHTRFMHSGMFFFSKAPRLQARVSLSFFNIIKTSTAKKTSSYFNGSLWESRHLGGIKWKIM